MDYTQDGGKKSPSKQVKDVEMEVDGNSDHIKTEKLVGTEMKDGSAPVKKEVTKEKSPIKVETKADSTNLESVKKDSVASPVKEKAPSIASPVKEKAPNVIPPITKESASTVSTEVKREATGSGTEVKKPTATYSPEIKQDSPQKIDEITTENTPTIASETIMPINSLYDPYGKPSLCCSSCRKRFEQSEIKTIQGWPYPTLIGDDYYEYTCQSCSKTGQEVVSRVSLGWLDVVTLTFLNLDSPHFVQEDIKYYHWKQNICEFIEKNWNRFWAKPKSSTWKNSVASCLSTGPRFKSLSKSSVMDSTVGLWGLDISIFLSEPRKFKSQTISLDKNGELLEESKVQQPKKVKEQSSNSATTKRKKVLNLQLDFDPDNAIEIYPDLDNPKTLPKLSTESTHSAPQCRISPNGMSVTNPSGYRMVKATHGVWSGNWYFEIKFEKSGSCRIGWSQISGDLQAPCGYDQFSYSFRSSPGSLFHASRERPAPESYKVGYKVGDVLGCVIVLPEVESDLEVDERLLARLWDPERTESYMPFQTMPMIKIPNSRIEYYLNGQPLGTAFTDIYQGIIY